MKPKKFVLWIEDEGTYNLADYAAPVTMHRDFDLTLVTTITDAIRFLKQREYHVIVVDLRNLPGNDRRWIAFYNQLAQDEVPLRLGLHLLLNLFGKPTKGCEVDIDQNDILLGNKNINRYCILSVDPLDDVQNELKKIGFKEDNYQQKRADLPRRALLDLIQKMVS